TSSRGAVAQPATSPSSSTSSSNCDANHNYPQWGAGVRVTRSRAARSFSGFAFASGHAFNERDLRLQDCTDTSTKGSKNHDEEYNNDYALQQQQHAAPLGPFSSFHQEAIRPSLECRLVPHGDSLNPSRSGPVVYIGGASRSTRPHPAADAKFSTVDARQQSRGSPPPAPSVEYSRRAVGALAVGGRLVPETSRS
ncbi:unnamed protein product, partial [Amoebophrya sp. A25]